VLQAAFISLAKESRFSRRAAAKSVMVKLVRRAYLSAEVLPDQFRWRGLSDACGMEIFVALKSSEPRPASLLRIPACLWCLREPSEGPGCVPRNDGGVEEIGVMFEIDSWFRIPGRRF